MDEKTKYNYMENVLQDINKKFIKLSEEEVARNNAILNEVVSIVIKRMKENNELFESLYRTLFYGGSFFDGLKISEPEEFDLDLTLQLPKIAKPTLTVSDHPGFVCIQLKDYEIFLKQPEAGKYRNLINLLDDERYLISSKVSAWMESVVITALNTFDEDAGGYIIPVNGKRFRVKVHKAGPAFTLKLSAYSINIDVDLVPSFVFTEDKWPIEGYRSNPEPSKIEFLIVPKRPDVADNGRYWRLSFQDQEKVLIKNNRTLKPAIRLLKRLRDVQNHHPIASYYIKTVFLWEVQEGDKSLWDNSLSYVFMQMLRKYKEKIESKNIPYFWNEENNLIGAVKNAALGDIKNKLNNIIKDIEKHPNDQYVIVKYMGNMDSYSNSDSDWNSIQVQNSSEFNQNNAIRNIAVAGGIAAGLLTLDSYSNSDSDSDSDPGSDPDSHVEENSLEFNQNNTLRNIAVAGGIAAGLTALGFGLNAIFNRTTTDNNKDKKK